MENLPSVERQRLDRLKAATRNPARTAVRTTPPPDVAGAADHESLSWMRRAARLVTEMCRVERPVITEDERIVFTRTCSTVPPIYRPEQWSDVTSGRRLHELGPISNICADWGMVLSQGLSGRRRAALDTLSRLAGDAEARDFLESAVETIDAVLGLAARYREHAASLGRHDVADCLGRVPAEPPRTFRQALQMLRLLHAVVWMGGHYHVGLGRLDQYLWPYLESDLAAGRLDDSAARALLAEFFLSLNRDSDLYPGVQQGDNGQSLMLGGVRRDGADAVNPLTWMVLDVARYTAMIDPKINLRISASTSRALLERASRLTCQGLGFPQYSNDDVVIPALVAHGYALEDARDYSVAACWEFIVPGRGMEVVNIGAVSCPLAADRAIRAGLVAGDSMDGIRARCRADIVRQAREVAEPYRRLLLPPAPYYSVLMDGCLERGRDLSRGLTYNNFGIHGAGAANAADALAATASLVFGDGSVGGGELIAALDENFQGREPLRLRLEEEAPKVGQGGAADTFLRFLFDCLADACHALGENGRGGHFRAGSGSAMYYVWLARELGATAEGRKAGESLGANLAPSLNARTLGPFSIFRSFSQIDYSRVCNGGPVTLELSDATFAGPESLTKCAQLVQAFVHLGCQQLQVNTLNAATLQDAKAHPERHRNLIVRVWGWSGYFCELAPEYQDHVIARALYRV